MSAIELRGVSKQYARNRLRGGEPTTALRDVDLTIPAGEIFGFLGPNGAGKSTTIDLLLGLKRPTAGSIRVLGDDVGPERVDVRRRIGVLPEGAGAIGERTGRQHVAFAIETKGANDDPDALLARVGMHEVADYAVTEYSKGMRQRLLLAIALVGAPDVLILDEPTTGLDPNGARLLREIVREENDRGATVFFSSHILEQVEAVCDRVGILDDGELVAVDTVVTLRERLAGTTEVRVDLSAVPTGLLEAIREVAGVVSVAPEETSVRVTCRSDAKADVIGRCYAADATVEDLAITEASLDEMFGQLTAGGSR